MTLLVETCQPGGNWAPQEMLSAFDRAGSLVDAAARLIVFWCEGPRAVITCRDQDTILAELDVDRAVYETDVRSPDGGRVRARWTFRAHDL